MPAPRPTGARRPPRGSPSPPQAAAAAPTWPSTPASRATARTRCGPRWPAVAGGGAVTPTGSGQQSAHKVFQAPTARRSSTTPTTADTGYQESLPFAPRTDGDPAVVARLDEDGDDGGQRQTLLLIA